MGEEFLRIDPPKEFVRKVRATTVKHLLDGSGFTQKPNAYNFLRENFGFDYQNPPTTYSYHLYVEMAKYIRTNYYNHLDEEAGFELLGYLAVMDYYNSVVGKMVKMAAGLLGPERVANQFLIKIRGTLGWAEHSYEFKTHNSAHYRVKYLSGPPSMMRGAIRASMEISGAKITELYSIVLEEEDVIHVVKWQ